MWNCTFTIFVSLKQILFIILKDIFDFELKFFYTWGDLKNGQILPLRSKQCGLINNEVIEVYTMG